MKKIIISAATLQKGGAERVISLLSKEFLQYFDSVEIITWLSAPVGYEIDSRVKVVDIQTVCKSSNLLCKMISAALFTRCVRATETSTPS